jgi:hypothetical protein
MPARTTRRDGNKGQGAKRKKAPESSRDGGPVRKAGGGAGPKQPTSPAVRGQR